MVATVLGLRFRTAWRLIRREWWRGMMTGLGVLWVIAFFPSLMWIRSFLSFQAPDVRADITAVAITVLGIGWILVPLVLSGIDDTLDPARFRSFGSEARQLMPGLTAAAFLTLPVAFHVLMFTMVTRSWSRADGAVMAVAAAGLAATLATYVFGARVAAMWGSRVLASRRARGAVVLVMVVSLALLIPVASVMFRDGLETVLETDVEVLIAQLGATPLASGAVAPVHALAGDWWGAAWRIALPVVWAVLLHAVWRVNVARALVVPLARGGGTRPRDDAIVASRRLPGLDDAAAAVHVRLRRAWSTDPRYLATLAGVAILPAAFVTLAMPALGLDARWLYAVPLILAAAIGWGRHNDVAFDSSALWLDVVSGTLGRAIMRGRMSATAAWALPLVLGIAVAALAWTGRWGDAPALLGACVGVLGVTLGIAAVAAVLVPYRAPGPGENPFGAEVGSVGAGLAAQIASSLATAVALPVVVVPLVLSLTVSPWWGAVACVVGIGAGVAGYMGGVRLAGVAYDRRAGTLLAAVT